MSDEATTRDGEGAPQSFGSRMMTRLIPLLAPRVFPDAWLEAGDDRQQLTTIAAERRKGDGPRPDLLLQRHFRRATTEIEGRELHLLTPPGGSTGRVLFYCHGGAFVVGPSAVEWLFAAKLARRLGTDLALYDYPKVPEHDGAEIRPATIAAWDTIAERYERAAVTIAGTSAGGGLAVATVLQLARSGRPTPNAAALFSPWLDMTIAHPDVGPREATDVMLPVPTLRRDGELYAGADNPTDPIVSPRFASTADLGAMPPTVVTVGEHEILRPEGEEFAGKLATAGVRSSVVLEPFGQHVGVMGGAPEGKAAFDRAVSFLHDSLLSAGIA